MIISPNASTKTLYPACMIGSNSSGKDYVVSSIRGDARSLNSLLESLHFNPKSDRIFTLGNLFSDGCNWQQMAVLLLEDWLMGVRGWQEHVLQIAIAELREDSKDKRFVGIWTQHFGTDIFKLPPEALRQIEAKLTYWPYIAKHVSLRGGKRTALIAREIPKGIDLDDFRNIAVGSKGEPTKSEALEELTYLLTGTRELLPGAGPQQGLVNPKLTPPKSKEESLHGDSLFSAMKYESYAVSQHVSFERVLTGEIVSHEEHRLNTKMLGKIDGKLEYALL